MEKLKKLLICTAILTKIFGTSAEALSAAADSINADESSPVSLVSGAVENDNDVIISGDTRFINRIEDAMDLLRTFPNFYELVRTYLKRIYQCNDNHTLTALPHGAPDQVYARIGNDQISQSLTWIAGELVHRAYHAKLFFGYEAVHNRYPDGDIWARGIGEMKCLEIQKDFLREANAPQRYLRHLEDWSYIWWRQHTREGRQGNPLPERFRTDEANKLTTLQPRSEPVRHHHLFNPNDPRLPRIMKY